MLVNFASCPRMAKPGEARLTGRRFFRTSCASAALSHPDWRAALEVWPSGKIMTSGAGIVREKPRFDRRVSAIEADNSGVCVLCGIAILVKNLCHCYAVIRRTRGAALRDRRVNAIEADSMRLLATTSSITYYIPEQSH